MTTSATWPPSPRWSKLRSEGVPGLLVCSGSDEVAELADRADLVVDGPAGVVALLARWRRAGTVSRAAVAAR